MSKFTHEDFVTTFNECFHELDYNVIIITPSLNEVQFFVVGHIVALGEIEVILFSVSHLTRT